MDSINTIKTENKVSNLALIRNILWTLAALFWTVWLLPKFINASNEVCGKDRFVRSSLTRLKNTAAAAEKMKDPVSAPEDTNHLEDTLSLVREHISQQDKLHEACNRSLLAWIWKTAVHAFLGRTENVPKMNDILADILKMTMEDIKQAKQEKGQAT